MHICVVSPGYPTSKTIDFIFVDQLCRALADKGIQVTIIAPQSVTKSVVRKVPLSPVHSLLKTSKGKKINLYRPLYFTAGTFGEFMNFNKRGFDRALKSVFVKLKLKPDVCYGHFWDSVYSLLPLAKNNNIPLIASSGEETVAIQKKISVAELQKLTEYVKAVISVSSKNKEECLESNLVKAEDCIVIPNAVDSSLFYPKNKTRLREYFGYAKSDFIVAFVGQFHSRKGIDNLDKALINLNDDSVKALFIGTGPECPDYKGTLLAKTIPHNLLPDYLNCADVFVLPSLNEGMSNAIIEAMACGLPIISSDLPFNYDILNKDNAVLIDPKNIAQIAEAIRNIKLNPQRRKQLSDNSLKTASTLTLSIRADKIIQFIKIKI